jgi:single-strand DNA-binding protein
MYWNKVQIGGNLGNDPQVKTLPNGQNVCEFSIAVTESYKDSNGQQQKNTEWINVVAWGSKGDTIAKYFQKGSAIFIEGKWKNESWTDQNTQQKVTRSRVVLSTFAFVNGGNGSGQGQANQYNQAPQQNNQQVPAQQVPAQQVPAQQVPAQQVPAQQAPVQQYQQVPPQQVAPQQPPQNVPSQPAPSADESLPF